MRPTNNILRELQRDSSVIDRFWASVNRDDTADGCWEWLRCSKGESHPTFRAGRYSITAAHVAWFTGTGELPTGGHVRHLCDNRRCVRPSHLAWAIGRRTERDLTLVNAGYGELSGAAVSPTYRDPTCPRVFRVISDQQGAA